MMILHPTYEFQKSFSMLPSSSSFLTSQFSFIPPARPAPRPARPFVAGFTGNYLARSISDFKMMMMICKFENVDKHPL